jgi:RNA polymerase sigma factor (sigma-70 family)
MMLLLDEHGNSGSRLQAPGSGFEFPPRLGESRRRHPSSIPLSATDIVDAGNALRAHACRSSAAIVAPNPSVSLLPVARFGPHQALCSPALKLFPPSGISITTSLMTDFEELYERHARNLYRFALYLCGSHAEAEDIVAETFVRAWNTPARIRVATAKAYLFTIARNCYLHGKRRAWRATELDDELRDPSQGPQATIEQQEELTRVWSALRAMPEVDRSALLMSALEEMPYKDIAVALALTVQGVKTKIHRARLRLAQLRDAAEVKR